MSELVIISKDGFPYSKLWVQEKSPISNNVQSIYLIVLRGRNDYCCKWDSGARNVKLIQLQHHTYIMDSVNLENYAWIYVHKDDRDQDGVLLEIWFFADYDIQIHCLEDVFLKVPKVSEFLRLGLRLFHSIMVDGIV